MMKLPVKIPEGLSESSSERNINREENDARQLTNHVINSAHAGGQRVSGLPKLTSQNKEVEDIGSAELSTDRSGMDEEAHANLSLGKEMTPKDAGIFKAVTNVLQTSEETSKTDSGLTQRNPTMPCDSLNLNTKAYPNLNKGVVDFNAKSLIASVSASNKFAFLRPKNVTSCRSATDASRPRIPVLNNTQYRVPHYINNSINTAILPRPQSQAMPVTNARFQKATSYPFGTAVLAVNAQLQLPYPLSQSENYVTLQQRPQNIGCLNAELIHQKAAVVPTNSLINGIGLICRSSSLDSIFSIPETPLSTAGLMLANGSDHSKNQLSTHPQNTVLSASNTIASASDNPKITLAGTQNIVLSEHNTTRVIAADSVNAKKGPANPQNIECGGNNTMSTIAPATSDNPKRIPAHPQGSPFCETSKMVTKASDADSAPNRLDPRLHIALNESNSVKAISSSSVILLDEECSSRGRPVTLSSRKSKYDKLGGFKSIVIKKPKLVDDHIDDKFCQNNNIEIRNTCQDDRKPMINIQSTSESERIEAVQKPECSQSSSDIINFREQIGKTINDSDISDAKYVKEIVTENKRERLPSNTFDSFELTHKELEKINPTKTFASNNNAKVVYGKPSGSATQDTETKSQAEKEINYPIQNTRSSSSVSNVKETKTATTNKVTTGQEYEHSTGPRPKKRGNVKAKKGKHVPLTADDGFDIMTHSTTNSVKTNALQSRYMKDRQSVEKGTNSFKEILKNDGTEINKIEADKLNAVKDHHLLTLSDQEKNYLKSKQYLNTDPSLDVKRRLESKQKSGKDQALRSLLNAPIVCKESKTVNINSCTNKIVKSTENPLNMAFDTTENQQMKIKNSVDKLHRLDNTKLDNSSIDAKQIPSGSEVGLKNPTPQEKPTPRKVYYVINCKDIHRQEQNRSDESGSVINPSTANLLKTQTDIKAVTQPPSLGPTQLSIKCISKSAHKATGTTQVLGKANSLNSNTISVISENYHIVSAKPSSTVASQPSYTKSSNVRPHYNSATVRQLLRAKREGQSTSTIATSIQKQKPKIINLPFSMFKRAVTGRPLKIDASNIQTVAVQMAATANLNEKATSSDTATYSGNPITTAITGISLLPDDTLGDSAIKNNNLAQNLRVINAKNVLKPSILIPVGMVSQSPQPLPASSTSPMPPFAEVPSSKDSETVPVNQNETKTSDSVVIKIGNQTLLVKKKQTKGKPTTQRKTLPAPKPKPSSPSYVKRRRNRPIIRQRVVKHSGDLKCKLKQLLQNSNEPIHKLVETLELVPMSLLKILTKKGVYQKKHTDESPTKDVEFTVACKNNSLPSKDSTEEFTDNPLQPETKIISVANMANIVQISTDDNYNTSFSVNQVRVNYGIGKSGEYHRPFNYSDYPCCLYFSKEGRIEKVDIESLRQGLYLVQDWSEFDICKRSETSFKSVLILIPPHLASVPPKSLALAVGDIYSEAQREQYVIKPEGRDIQAVLQTLLWPIVIENIEEVHDSRYGSVIDHSMSPKVCSRMFYSEKLRHAFDTGEYKTEKNTLGKEESANDVKRSDSNASLFEGTRFSERAMALKIKQNELFESCRRIKTERLSKVKQGKKRKRETISKDETSTVGPEMDESAEDVIICDDI